MGKLTHLILPRIKFNLPRKKHGFGHVPKIAYAEHAKKLTFQVDEFLADFNKKPPLKAVDPSLILRIHLDPNTIVDEDTWERCGFSLLSIEQNKTFILFSSDNELTEFKRRLDKYKGGPQGEAKNAPYNPIFSSIMNVEAVKPRDRIGRLFREEGIDSVAKLNKEKVYVIDIQLWDFLTKKLNQEKLNQITKFITENGGANTDSYNDQGLVLIRASCKGKVIEQLLSIDSIANIDFPPKPSLSASQQLQTRLTDFPDVKPPHKNAPGVVVMDSGVTSGHPFLKPAIGEAAAFPMKGDSQDKLGHGTLVCGLALYGDVSNCIHAKVFEPEIKLYSCKVLNDKGTFDDEKLITSQMREAITYFVKTYNCRVFNLSLGDPRLSYKGGKVSPWAAILDTLSRELNIVIIVSVGNYIHPADPAITLKDYPRYLLEEEARVIEPGTGCIVLTVGSLAHSANIPAGSASHQVSYRPVAALYQPSPFTRTGPGIGASIKPEVCEDGGNFAFDGQLKTMVYPAELSVVSMNNDYLNRLFHHDIGTSFAAPKVAYMATKIVSLMPGASSNLIRAFIAASAVIPNASKELLEDSKNAIYQFCGYGKPDLDYALGSAPNRVMLYSDSSIQFDYFHIYQLPIPREFHESAGTKKITITLAFDPPVRHTRFDYLGVNMSFRLIRGKNAEEVKEAFRKRTQKEPKADSLSSSKFCLTGEPSPTIREGGTLQKAVYSTTSKYKEEYGQNYYVVVLCEKKWALEEVYGEQRYGLVVTLEHSDSVDLYSEIKQRVEVPIRVRARAR